MYYPAHGRNFESPPPTPRLKKLACGDWENWGKEGLKKLSKHRLTRNPLGWPLANSESGNGLKKWTTWRIPDSFCFAFVILCWTKTAVYVWSLSATRSHFKLFSTRCKNTRHWTQTLALIFNIIARTLRHFSTSIKISPLLHCLLSNPLNLIN